MDLSIFESRYKNNEIGAPAYDPGIIIEIVLYAYSSGITSSREIEKLCNENVVFIALSANTHPYFTKELAQKQEHQIDIKKELLKQKS